MLTNLTRRVRDAINWRLRTFNGGRWAVHCRPTSVVIVLTMRCTAHCVHCDIWKRRGREEGLATLERVEADARRRAELAGTGTRRHHRRRGLAEPPCRQAPGLRLVTRPLHGDVDARLLARPDPHRGGGAGPALAAHDVDGRRGTSPQRRPRTRRLLGKVLARRRHAHPPAQRGAAGLRDTAENRHHAAEPGRCLQRGAVSPPKTAWKSFTSPSSRITTRPKTFDWFKHSANWPRDPAKAVAVVQQLIDLKRQGLPICNSFSGAGDDGPLLPRSRERTNSPCSCTRGTKASPCAAP